MIDEIHVQNVALIRDAVLVPACGLTVVTGETGSGKTALLSALKLLCGERASSDMVREASPELLVEGRFYRANDPQDDSVVTRRVTAEGRSRITLDGAMASVGELAVAIGASVDLCGQHEHQRLLKVSGHRRLFDSWTGDPLADDLSAYGKAFQEAKAAQDELTRIQEAARVSAAKLDEATFLLERIRSVDPEEGEYDELAALLSRSENAEALALATDSAYQALSGDEGAIDSIHAAASALEKAAAFDEQLDELAQSLREQVYLLEDVSRDALRVRDSIEYDPEILAYNQERFAAMQGLMRSFGPRMEDVFAKRDRAEELIALAEGSEEVEQAAREQLDRAEAALAKAADALDAVRAKEIPRFSQAVNEQLARLEMASAKIECALTRLDRADWTAESPSRIEFLFRPGEGLTARPLARIASGGEISRVMLAIKVVLGASDEVETLVFDEVDAGVGGTAAVALAAVLADLAQTHQVIVVTHLAQVAVVGERHYLVVKESGAVEEVPQVPADDLSKEFLEAWDSPEIPVEDSLEASEAYPEIPATEIVEVSGEARVDEIARMLSGTITETSRRHAEELLNLS